jgi:hypothetical protein
MSKKNVSIIPDSPSGELDENQTGPLKLMRAKTMPKPCLMPASTEMPSTDPTVRPTRSVSFRDADQVLVFGQNDAPMACGPDWDPDKFEYGFEFTRLAATSLSDCFT